MSLLRCSLMRSAGLSSLPNIHPTCQEFARRKPEWLMWKSLLESPLKSYCLAVSPTVSRKRSKFSPIRFDLLSTTKKTILRPRPRTGPTANRLPFVAQLFYAPGITGAQVHFLKYSYSFCQASRPIEGSQMDLNGRSSAPSSCSFASWFC